jgi:hypothetical protein
MKLFGVNLLILFVIIIAGSISRKLQVNNFLTKNGVKLFFSLTLTFPKKAGVFFTGKHFKLSTICW